MATTALIALDWGTTVARAYCVDSHGNVLDARSAPLGAAQLSKKTFPAALARLLGEWVDHPAPRLACGMVGSRDGWREAPYLWCPVSLNMLATGLVEVPGERLKIAPGVATRDAAGIPDVMRGEETQIAGAIHGENERALAVTPGTHSKWIRVERGRIIDFLSFMTGELYAVMIAHSVLGRFARDPLPASETPGPAFLRGVDRGLERGFLSHDMFGARTLVLHGEITSEEAPDWLSGLLIGREIRNARTWAQRHGDDAAKVRLIGTDALVTRYAAACARADIGVDHAPSNAAARGLWQIALEAGLVDRAVAH